MVGQWIVFILKRWETSKNVVILRFVKLIYIHEKKTLANLKIGLNLIIRKE